MGFESELGAMDLGSEVGAETHGTEVGAKICGSDLDVRVRGTDLHATSAPLGRLVLPGQASRRQDLRRRDVLPRRRR